MVTDNYSFIIVYIDTVSPVGEQFFRLAQTSIGILQYLLSNPFLSICLSFEQFLISLYLQYFFFVYFFWDSNRSLRTFAVIIEYRSVQDKQCLIISTVYTKEFCRNVVSRVLAICWGRTSVISTNNYNHTCGNAIHKPPYKICTYA